MKVSSSLIMLNFGTTQILVYVLSYSKADFFIEKSVTKLVIVLILTYQAKF